MKTKSLLSDLLSRVTDIGKLLDGGQNRNEGDLIQLCQHLIAREGEATSLAQAQEILNKYDQLTAADKKQFFEDIITHFGANQEELAQQIKAWLKNRDDISARQLHFISEPKSQTLFRRLNQAPNATCSLVNMRKDLLTHTKDSVALNELDRDMAHLFGSWFNRGFLQLQQIDWSTPAAILEKIIAYEAVHEIQGWDDLRQRVAAPDRRLYAYFHPALGDEPLIFVEVALVKEVPSSIDTILQDDREILAADQAKAAVFYSISNCQKGLKGISFGNFLIKQVVETLRQEFENLETFITLSPVPGFRRWVTQIAKDEIKIQDPEDPKLLPMLAEYLTSTKLGKAETPSALDPVARFHLGNGARLEALHQAADLTENGLKNSWGCMVNYKYHIKDIEKNHEAYFNHGEIIISPKVSKILNT